MSPVRDTLLRRCKRRRIRAWESFSACGNSGREGFGFARTGGQRIAKSAEACSRSHIYREDIAISEFFVKGKFSTAKHEERKSPAIL